MKPALSCALGALLVGTMVACVEPGTAEDFGDGVVGPATHDPGEAQANEAEGSERALAADGALVNGVPVTGLAGARRTMQNFTIDVPANATHLVLAISGGTGDADLYVKQGSAPTTSSYDARPYLNGNNETVTVETPVAGTYFLMVRAYAAYSGVTLVASFNTPEPPPPPGMPDAGPPDAGSPPPPPPPPPTGPDCTNAATWPADWVAFEDQVLVLVNQQRLAGATCGGVVKPPVPALVMDANLRQAARCHSQDMAVHNYFSHDSQDGRSPWTRISNAGYTGFGNAENIAAGQGTPASVMTSWMNSTGHCNNIMTAGSNEIGVGYAFDASSDYDRYWTQDFGKR
jgi:uncharacterized protein YkwD